MDINATQLMEIPMRKYTKEIVGLIAAIAILGGG